MFIISSGDNVGDEPGLWSVASAIGTPASRSAATGGNCVSQKVVGPRQQHGNGTRTRHRVNAIGANILQMVATQGANSAASAAPC